MIVKTHPARKFLPHEVPSWVPQGARHFITFGLANRTERLLTQPEIATTLLDSAFFYEEAGRWYLWLMVVMPDHVHLILSFPWAASIRRTLAAWKHYQARQIKTHFQRDFFEHRLRDDDEFQEKCSYVRMNPVRKGLAANMDDWPWVCGRQEIEGRARSPSAPPWGSNNRHSKLPARRDCAPYPRGANG